MPQLRIFLANLGQRRPLHPLVTPPLGIMYIAAYLRKKQSVSIEICNQKLSRISDKELINKIVYYRPHIIGLSVMTQTSKNLQWIIEKLRKAIPHSWIIVGGPHATALGKKLLLNTKAHGIAMGEGEIVFEQIVSAYPDLNELNKIQGLITNESFESSFHKGNNSPQYIDCLDSLPLPAYDLINIHQYWKEQSMPPVPRRKYLTLFSSRGCPCKCSYCHNIFGKSFRQHSPERMVDEIAYYHKKYGIDDFEFVDDIFNLNPSFVFNFCEHLHRRNLKIKIAFPNGVRGDMLNHDIIHALADAGMYFCAFAIESGSPRIQQQIKKNLNIERCLENIRIAQKRRVFCHGFAMMGFPGETAQEMQMTIDVVANSRLHTASFFTVTPLPGSDLYNQIQKKYPGMLDKIEYKELSELTINLSDTDDALFLQIKRTALRKVMINPSRIKRILFDFPQPHLLPLYFPEFLRRITLGLFQYQ